MTAARTVTRPRSSEDPTVSRPRVGRFDWREHAACLDVDPETFHAIGVDWEAGASAARLVEAKTVCARCPVRQVCRDDGIERRDEWAVLGGMSPRERSDYARAQARRHTGGES